MGYFLEQSPHNSSLSTTLLAPLHNKTVENEFKIASFLINNIAVIYTLPVIYNNYICWRSCSLHLPLKT